MTVSDAFSPRNSLTVYDCAAHLDLSQVTTMTPTRGGEGDGVGSEAESSLVLLERARVGDAQALDRLLGRYLPRLRRWASGRLSPHQKGLADTDDLVQETLLRTLRNIESFKPQREGALLAYLRQGVLNCIRDEARRARRRPVSSELQPDEPDPGASPLEEAIGRENVERYEAALGRLRDEDREAIVARIELGCSYDELALALGKPTPDAARMAVSRALLRLAKEIGCAS